MLISIQAHLAYSAATPCDLLLQIEAAQGEDQDCFDTELLLKPQVDSHIVHGEDQIGQRRWIHVEKEFDCSYRTKVRVSRPLLDISQYQATPLTALPSDVTRFLMPSRYCHPEAFVDFMPQQFGTVFGGALIGAASEWIRHNFTYDNGASHASTTATESFAARAGVCRDYAHVLIAMARAVGIPARFVSAYAPDVAPQDFHAVVEVFLAGRWHLVDPTGMAQVQEIVRIGVGRDAADVSFMTSYGLMTLINQSVHVSRVD